MSDELLAVVQEVLEAEGQRVCADARTSLAEVLVQVDDVVGRAERMTGLLSAQHREVLGFLAEDLQRLLDLAEAGAYG